MPLKTITQTWNKYTTMFSYKCFLFQTRTIQKLHNTKPKLENARGTKWHIFIRCWSELWSALTSQLEKLEETKHEMTFLKIFKKWTILQSPNLKLKCKNWNIFWWWNIICIRDVNDNRDFNFFFNFWRHQSCYITEM